MRPNPFETPPETRWNILSLGAGVQSSTLALMAAHGEIGPRLDAAIFADTQAEPRAVYRWLDWLEGAIAAASHPFPVHRVTAGNLRHKALSARVTPDGRWFSRCDLPVFTRNADGSSGIVQRSCTEMFKLRPVWRKVREVAEVRRGQRDLTVTQWIGISYDEMQRMKDSRFLWVQNRYPLVEQRLRRADCLQWMRRHGYPEPPRSACEFCPFHNTADWQAMKRDDPEAFARAVQFERDLQHLKAQSERHTTMPYLHPSLVPLDRVDFSTAEERGQLGLFQGECEGMCGV